MPKKSKITLMEVCGTHTMAIARSGLKKLLPEGIKLISGPGCPVCVTPQGAIDRAVKISLLEGVILATFGDMLRVPGSRMGLEEAAQTGADVRVVYSSLDALGVAQKNPEKKIVFMGVGFETTSPTVAVTIRLAREKGIKNFFILSYFKLIFPALGKIASSPRIKVDGFICPGHVSVITGSIPYERIARRYKKPCVITGFEEIDIIEGIKRLVKLIKNNSYKVEIEYKRAVRKNGNSKAREIIDSVFEAEDSLWRGLGVIKESGLRLKDKYRDFDAGRKFKVRLPRPCIPRGCRCGEVLQGIISPRDCRLFGKACTPRKPVGPCMVSSEGTCAAYYKYGL